MQEINENKSNNSTNSITSNPSKPNDEMVKNNISKFHIRQTITDLEVTDDVDEHEEQSRQPSITSYTRLVMVKPSNLSRINHSMMVKAPKSQVKSL